VDRGHKGLKRGIGTTGPGGGVGSTVEELPAGADCMVLAQGYY